MMIARSLLPCMLLFRALPGLDAQGGTTASKRGLPWWDLVSQTFESNNLRRCPKRLVPPTNGTRCARRGKTCFWGNQTCGDGAYPDVQCDCKQRSWTCSDVQCPAPPPPPPPIVKPFSCELGINNPAECPATQNGICESVSLPGESCDYGEISCCGECFIANQGCFCFQVGSPPECPQDGACFQLACQFDEAAWAAFVGTTACDSDAMDIILADYPGMEVLCIADGSQVENDFSNNRVKVFFDPATGLVSQPPVVG